MLNERLPEDNRIRKIATHLLGEDCTPIENNNECIERIMNENFGLTRADLGDSRAA